MTPEALAELHARCFDTAPRPWSPEEFAGILAARGVRLLTVEGGFAVFRLAGPEAEVMTLAVDPGKRRQGKGRRLVRMLLDEARVAGAAEVLLEVSEYNEAAISLYEKQGFERAGHRKDYYQGPRGTKAAAIVMRRLLAPAD